VEHVGSIVYDRLQTEVVEEQVQLVSVESFRDLRNSLIQQRIRHKYNAAHLQLSTGYKKNAFYFPILVFRLKISVPVLKPAIICA
jgi:hypothetical protein